MDLRIRVTPDLNYLYVLDMYFGVFVVSLKDIFTTYDTNNKAPLNLSVVAQFNLEGVMYGMEISKDGNFLLVS